MLAILIILAVSVISVMLNMAIEDVARLAMEKEGRIRVAAVRQLSEDLDLHARERGQYPSDLETLSGTAGFEYTRHYLDAGICLQGIPNTGEYMRTIPGIEEDGIIAVDITAVNWRRFYDAAPLARDCSIRARTEGLREFHWQAANWEENLREREYGQMLRQRRQMTRTLNKFAHYYNLEGAFPGDSETSNLRLNAGAGDACQGVYSWQDSILLDCADLFSVWGTDMHLYKKAPDHIILVATPDPAPDRGSLYVSSELNLHIPGAQAP